jgi:hypothetical protein
MVFLSLLKHETGFRGRAQVHLVKPRESQNVHVFKVMIHIDVMEDLMFYHFPRDELLAHGKFPRREFRWQFGKADGELNEEEPISTPPTRHCDQGARNPHRHPRDDEDDYDKSQRTQRPRGFLSRFSR